MAAAHNEDPGLGVGFVLGNGIVGIDLDKCGNPQSGDIQPWAQGIVDQIKTYAEISVSGTGLHLLAARVHSSRVPERGRREKESQYRGLSGRALLHHDRRTNCPGPSEPQQRQAELAAFCAEHFKVVRAAARGGVGAPPPAPVEPTPEQRAAFRKHPKADATWKQQRADLADQSASCYDLALACIAVKAGFSDGNILWLLRKWRTEHGEDVGKLNRQDYIRRTIATARDSELIINANKLPQEPSPEPAGFDFRKKRLASDLIGRQFNEPNWVIEGVLPEGLALLAGKPKVGKSWLALQMAMGVACGWDRDRVPGARYQPSALSRTGGQ